MMSVLNRRQLAFLQIFTTALLWGTSFVLIRLGLADLGPLTLAGLRYTLAGVLLLPVIKLKGFKIMDYKYRFWQLALLGILSFTIGNGCMGLALKYLPSTNVSLLTNLTDPLILLLSIVWLKETPKFVQFIGVVFALVGIILYFSPQNIPFANPGILIIGIALFGFSFYALLGRFIARSNEVPFWVQTSIPFIVGGTFLLVLALLFEGIPSLSLKAGLIIGWMVFFNSIIGYLLYNNAIAELTAVEINIMLKLTPFSTAVFAWILLGERISFLQLVAMVIVFAGIFLVQRGYHLPSKSS